MKQSKRIISFLMALVMILTAVPLSAYAYHTSYTSAGGYDILDEPYITKEQAASMVLDMVDAMLAKNNMTVPVDLSSYLLGSKTIDLRSIDQATTSIDNFWNWGTLDKAFTILNFADIERMNMTWIEQCPLRTAAGQNDLDVLLCLCRFLKDNAGRVGGIVADTFDYGFAGSYVPDSVHNIVGTLKESLLKNLNDGVDPPAGTTMDSLVNKMIDGLLIGEIDPVTGKYDGALPSMLGKTNINTTSVYTLTTDAINAGISDLIVPVLSKLLLNLAGVEFTEEYPGGDATNATYLQMIFDAITEYFGDITYTPEDLLTPLSKMDATINYLFIGGGLSSYIYLDDTGLHVTDLMVNMLNDLIGLALTFIPSLGILKNTTTFKTEAEVNAMTTAERYAYLGRLLVNEYVEFADVPDTCTSFRQVVTYFLIGMARDVLPENDYDAMIAAGTLNPNTDGVFIVGAALMRYYLNGLLPIDIPTGLNFEQTLNYLVDWFFAKYSGFFDMSDFKSTDTVWQKIDKVLFDIIQVNWLPAEFTGSRYLLMDWLLGNILDFDYVGLLSIVKRNPASELNSSVVTVLLNTFSRILKSALGSHEILPMNLTTVDSIFTKANCGSMVEKLCFYLYDYGNSFLGTLLPLATSLIGIWTKETYIRKAPAGSTLVTIDALKALLEAYNPENLNENIKYYETGYHFFGAEDFTELRNYFNYKQAKTEVRGLIDAYTEDPETLDLAKNTDAAYRVTFYYNRLVNRGTLCADQLTKEIGKSYDADYLHAPANTFTAASYATWLQAYNFAMQVRFDAITGAPGVRQSKISTARHMLFDAVKGLKAFVEFADYTELDVYIATAEDTLANLPALPDGYTPESIQALRDALSAAKNLPRDLSFENQDTVVKPVADALYYAIYGLAYILAPTIAPVPESASDFYGNPITPVVNTARKFIYGLSQGGFKIDNIDTLGGATISVSPVKNSANIIMGTGTGTKVKLWFGSMNFTTYTVVVFGDVNGDGNMDDGDAGTVVDFENYLYGTWATRGDLRYAADVNGDGNVTGADAGIIINSMNYIYTIDQTTGHVA